MQLGSTCLQAVQDAQEAGEISAEQADAAKTRYAKIHRHFVEAMAREKALLDQAKNLNEQLLVSMACIAKTTLDSYMVTVPAICQQPIVHLAKPKQLRSSLHTLSMWHSACACLVAMTT